MARTSSNPEVGHYRNKTSMTQVFYLPNGEKITVLEGDTVFLAVEYANNYPQVLEPVTAAEK